MLLTLGGFTPYSSSMSICCCVPRSDVVYDARFTTGVIRLAGFPPVVKLKAVDLTVPTGEE